MNLTCSILTHRRMVLTLAFLSAVVGISSWFYMPRQEDPKLRDYWGNITVIFPGTDTEAIEHLVLEPLEETLAEVEEIRFFATRIQSELLITHIELRNGVNSIEDSWDRVREAIEKAKLDFPEGVLSTNLDTTLNDQESIVLAITGGDLLAIKKKADALEKKLLQLYEVVGVRMIADPGEQVTIAFDDSQARRTGIDPRSLAQRIQGTNTKVPGGTIVLDGTIINLQPGTEYKSIEEIKATPIVLGSGTSAPLSEIATVIYGIEDPVKNLMRFNGIPAVGLGIIPRDGIHLLDFGKAIRNLVEAEAEEGFEIHEMAFQPDRVQKRLSDLGRSLILGILIVAVVLLLFMGFRLGLVVASVVPLVAFSSLGIYASAGGHLHQISIAALVIALGMLVDNAIVIAENVQWRIDSGATPRDAAVHAINELAAPLGSATGTTLAAFVPMYLSSGTTGEFTKSLPIVIMLTLTVSYFFAIAVTPALSEAFLKPKPKKKRAGIQKLAKRISNVSVNYPITVLFVIGIFVTISLLASPLIRQQFFPSSDRNQFLIEIKLQEGSHLDETDAIVKKLEPFLKEDPDIISYSSFIGRSAPHFYYNISQIPWSPHFAQILITTQSIEQVDPVIKKIRAFGAANLFEAHIIPRKLEQGPPVDSPVEIRLFGEDRAELSQTANRVLSLLRTIPGVEDARNEVSFGAPLIEFKVQEMKAAQFGLTRADIALSMLGRTQGLRVGRYTGSEDPVPIILRSSAGENYSVTQLETMDITAPGQQPVPLGQLATSTVKWRPASIKHRNGSRMIKVISQLGEKVAFSEVQSELERLMSEVDIPKGVRYEYGGQAEGSDEANSNIMSALPWGIFLLFGILLLEFNSFRRVAIILITVPLAGAGVVPGLLIGNQPFGFMSLLGVIALVGVVVNNAIVLIDVIETQRQNGLELKAAIQTAVQQRTRPILLTTLTTVAGLLPLAMSSSTLWPPLAWAMVSGLLSSTLLTLVAVPSLYFLLFKNSKITRLEPEGLCTNNNPIPSRGEAQ